ncbi:phytanoyl-CoA dioxygenase family protein [Salipiger mucosus]|uniref:Phytanoyl-CoA dioxygenase family protein n=1 Tax=Salipiger mucosus DSM 16094 TaxID=1123237 RepID=S9RP91_9RHOB|nr:phytanoyl-CoA dioxygenase family protein [Salipiger mucosus]EPX75839.1 phytanoyl-CoA dioxygenase family protein [Salipiger mucosus DSM 16094]
MSNQLSDRQVQAYERDGFVCPVDVFSAQEAAELRREYEKIEAQAATDPETKAALRDDGFISVPLVHRIVTDPRVVDAVESVMGPDILAWGCSFFVKEPRSPSYISWHQDLHYWGLDESEEVTAWIALSPAPVEAGCMRFAKGSHKSKVSHRDTFDERNLLSRGQEIEVDVDEADAVEAALRPGQMSLHHGLTIHASNPNTTDDRRIGLAVRYIRTSMRQTSDVRQTAKLVRGTDAYGYFDLMPEPSGLFDPADLARHTAALRAKREVQMKGTEMKV